MGVVKGLDHIAVTVSDMERSLAFYRDIMGFEVAEKHRLEGEGISQMAGKPDVVMQVVRLKSPEGPGILLDLQQYIQPKGTASNAELGMSNHSHFCYGVADLPSTYRDLKAKGVKFISAPVTFDLGEDWDYGALQVVFLKDPDGFILELLQMPEKSN
jgi:catechol 2,3-dioxygenase-like lactoylglutathione lyase family enzyme